MSSVHVRYAVSSYYRDVESEDGDSSVERRWRAYSWQTKKSFSASGREKLWAKIRKETGGKNCYRRKGTWIVEI